MARKIVPQDIEFYKFMKKHSYSDICMAYENMSNEHTNWNLFEVCVATTSQTTN